jgi:acyl carrier protein
MPKIRKFPFFGKRSPSRTILGAESVQSIELVAIIEEEFGIEMEEDAALSVETVSDAARYISKASAHK